MGSNASHGTFELFMLLEATYNPARFIYVNTSKLTKVIQTLKEKNCA